MFNSLNRCLYVRLPDPFPEFSQEIFSGMNSFSSALSFYFVVFINLSTLWIRILSFGTRACRCRKLKRRSGSPGSVLRRADPTVSWSMASSGIISRMHESIRDHSPNLLIGHWPASVELTKRTDSSHLKEKLSKWGCRYDVVWYLPLWEHGNRLKAGNPMTCTPLSNNNICGIDKPHRFFPFVKEIQQMGVSICCCCV